MRENNLQIGRLLAERFNKKIGIITYSGTLAIELALRACELPLNAGVIVSSKVCDSIITTIIKVGMKPIIICPKKDLIITSEEIEEVINVNPVQCILLVHQYGLINDISYIKKKYPKIKIIEDIAQTWIFKDYGTNIGKYSDYIVTSFGKTKPLSYGIGGAIMTNKSNIFNIVDFCDEVSRENKQLLFSYAYPLCEEIDIERLFILANENINQQQNVSEMFFNIFQKNNQIYFVKNLKGNAWHRFPLWIEDTNYYQKVINHLEKCGIEFQLPHNINTYELSLIKDKSIVYNQTTEKENIILLRTRIDDINGLHHKLSLLKSLMAGDV